MAGNVRDSHSDKGYHVIRMPATDTTTPESQVPFQLEDSRVDCTRLSDSTHILEEIKTLQAHLSAVRSVYGLEVGIEQTTCIAEAEHTLLGAYNYRINSEKEVVRVYNFLRMHDGNLKATIRQYMHYSLDHLASLPMRPELSLQIFGLLATKTSVRLDEHLLFLSVKLWKQNIPIHKFPNSVLRHVPQSKTRSHLFNFDYHYHSRWNRREFDDRTCQFLHETERITTNELLVSRIIAQRLPQELSDDVLSCLLECAYLPRLEDMKGIWAPWPRVTEEKSYRYGGDIRIQKVGELDCTIRWSAHKRKFVARQME
ncbi:hypothetical protein EJ08DRAFT_162518 [Tothia fuscella]|uniref:Uncharacterized protein n=1 Tax=Tothia fuscella TaxID=1048955 RepID=A0A9P4NTU3_9PEZI|nr:hypothetical protein EJ08DRAFT_162518 [Tothia fuscella]